MIFLQQSPPKGITVPYRPLKPVTAMPLGLPNASGSGNPVVSQNAAAAAAAAVAAATSQASFLSGNGSNGQAAQAAAAAAALSNPSALLPGNQVGDSQSILFQSPAKGATIPYRPSPSNTPTCICNSSSSSSLSSSCNELRTTVAAVATQQTPIMSTAITQPAAENTQQYSVLAQQTARPAAAAAVPTAQQQAQQQPLLLQMQPQTPFVSPNAPPASSGSLMNNNVFFPQPSMEEMAMYNPAVFYMPTVIPSVTSNDPGYLYSAQPNIDPFQHSLDLKTESLASPNSSTSSSSCSNYSMMMVPHATQQAATQQMAFYSPAVSPAAEVRSEEGKPSLLAL